MTGIACIDGDIISYRAAAANERRFVIAQHKETAEQHRFDTATAFKQWAGEEKDDYELTPGQEAEPVEHALHTIKKMINSITERAKCSSYHIVVSGENNFRLDLPLPTQYKSNRSDSIRPLQLKECRDYLINVHSAEVSEGCEADDILVGYAYQGYKNKEYVPQCTIDKDAKSSPGWLFDWTTMDEPEFIEGFGELTCTLRDTGKKKANGDPQMDKIIKGKGRVWTFYQLVLGDATDGYRPADLAKARFGDVGAYDLLKHAKDDKEALEAVVTRYKLWYPEPVTYRCWKGELHTKDWLEIMQMYADCCWMRRWDGDQLDMKKLLDKLKVRH